MNSIHKDVILILEDFPLGGRIAAMAFITLTSLTGMFLQRLICRKITQFGNRKPINTILKFNIWVDSIGILSTLNLFLFLGPRFWNHLDVYVAHRYCQFFIFINGFRHIHLVVGNFAMAFLRFMYLMSGLGKPSPIRMTKLLPLVVAIGILMDGLASWSLFTSVSVHHKLFFVCRATFTSQVIPYDLRPLATNPRTAKIGFAAIVCLLMGQILIYIVCFHIIQRHNCKHGKAALRNSQNAFQSRCRSNAITFFGHVMYLILEVLWYIVIFLVSHLFANNATLTTILIGFKSANYGWSNIFLALSMPMIRNRICQILCKFRPKPR